MGWTTQSLGQHLKMAFICVETKAEALMVKLLSSINQIVLIYCFAMMLIADMIRAESEEDYAFKKVTMTRAFSWSVRTLFQVFYLFLRFLRWVLLWRVEEEEYCLAFSNKQE